MLKQYISRAKLTEIVEAAREEDLGKNGTDITSEICIPDDQNSTAFVVAREDGVLSGADILQTIVQVYDDNISVKLNLQDGATLKTGQTIAEFSGPRRSILTMERTALNFLTHLSGIATLTAQFVEQTKHTKAQICDTRKTIPGLRGLEKYAVCCGGGVSHRIGLYDAVLIKDNHLAHIKNSELTKALARSITKAKQYQPAPKFIEIEVDNLEQLEQILNLDIDIVLLDNMNLDTLKQAVEMRNKKAPKIKLEASGGVNLQTVRNIAESGVDRISIGALTHSAPALDIALDV